VSAATAEPTDGAALGVLASLRRAAAVAPTLRRGLGLTLLLALVGTAGQVVVPIAVQQVIDRQVLGAEAFDPSGVILAGAVAVAALVVAIVANRTAQLRLVHSASRGLAELRVHTFRHVHDLSVLHVTGVWP
jgi:ATP-binding cassette, subfamily B, bacterial